MIEIKRYNLVKSACPNSKNWRRKRPLKIGYFFGGVQSTANFWRSLLFRSFRNRYSRTTMGIKIEESQFFYKTYWILSIFVFQFLKIWPIEASNAQIYLKVLCGDKKLSTDLNSDKAEQLHVFRSEHRNNTKIWRCLFESNLKRIMRSVE